MNAQKSVEQLNTSKAVQKRITVGALPLSTGNLVTESDRERKYDNGN